MKNYDIVIAGETPLEKNEALNIIKPYIAAGTTWWLEKINDWRGSFKEMKERIHKGPPNS